MRYIEVSPNRFILLPFTQMSITLSEINVYPIKSCRGFSTPSWSLEDEGLRLDRRWMLVDENGMFITQREHPRLALVSIIAETDQLRIHALQMHELVVPFSKNSPSTLHVTVWDDTVEAAVVSDKASLWFSNFLGTSCQLVAMTERTNRLVEQEYAFNQETVSFADAYPILLISEASLEDVNTRLPAPVGMNRFRPNLVVRGCTPFAEDSWKVIQIGGLRFKVVKPCARCVIPTVDPATGEKGIEPLRTLAAFRSVNNKVLFGQNLLPANTGTLRVGDEVTILHSCHPTD